MAINIAITDDHQLVIDGLQSILQDVDDFVIKGVCQNGEEAIKLVDVLKIDVLLMDVDMPVMDGIEATKRIKKDFPNTKVLILTMHDEKSIIKMLMEIGADGYLLKNSSQEELTVAIRNVASGKKHFSSDVTMALLSPDIIESNKNLQDLTEREIEILRHVAEGYSNKEIGEQLFISHRTVDTHRTNLMKKLDVRNIAGLIRFALKNGIVD